MAWRVNRLACCRRDFSFAKDIHNRIVSEFCDRYTSLSMSAPYRLGYLVPEFPRQTHIFFWRECEQLRRRGVEPIFLSTRKPPQTACPHEFRDVAAAATHYVFPPPISSLLDLLTRPIGVIRALSFWFRASVFDEEPAEISWPDALRAHLAGYCRRQGVRHIHVHSCGQTALLAAFCERLAVRVIRSHCIIRYTITVHCNGKNGEIHGSRSSSRGYC